MLDNKKVIAIIPARGGSKGLPGKNIKVLKDKPLIAWTIKAALNSNYIDDVVVSTDDEEIADISKEWGAEVPFLRSAELASDEASSVDVVIDLLEKLNLAGRDYDYLILLQPTSPFRDSDDIDEAFSVLKMGEASSIISFSEVDAKPFWMVKKKPDGTYESLIDDDACSRRQEFPEVYQYNGALYIIQTSLFKELKGFECKNTLMYTMSSEKSVDIDTQKDWDVAERLLNL